MEKKMETTIICRGYIGIMEKKLEYMKLLYNIVYRGYVGVILGCFRFGN